MSNRRLIQTYWEAFKDGDLDTYESCLAPDVVVTYPQSGEVIEGRDNYMATIRNYPMDLPEGANGSLNASKETSLVQSPFPFGLSAVTVIADGDLVVGTATLNYPNRDVFHVCTVFKVSMGAISEQTDYFAAPFEAPEWRSRWTVPRPAK